MTIRPLRFTICAMYIPTQEERYSKKGIVSLILCNIVPSCLYLSMQSKELMMHPGQEWDAVMKIFTAFAYPLAGVFSLMGIPFFWWAIGISVVLHGGFIYWLKKSKKLNAKKAVCIALSLGMLEFLILKLWPFPADIMSS